MAIISEEEAIRYSLLYDWAQERFPDESDVFLGEGYSPFDRWARLEQVYEDFLLLHPDDGIGAS